MLDHTVTPELVATRAKLSGEDKLDEATRCVDLAAVELEEALEDAFRPVPPAVLDEMVLRVAVDNARATKTTTGSSQTTQVEGGVTVRAPRDPLASVRPRLARYVAGLA